MPQKGRSWRSLRVVFVIVFLVLGGIPILGIFPNLIPNAAATSTTFLDNSRDGRIEYERWTPAGGTHYNVQAASDLEVGYWYDIYPNGSHLQKISRSYLSFDTSSLPDDATILSATLRVFFDYNLAWEGPSPIPNMVTNVYSSNFGILSPASWNSIGTLQGTIISSPIEWPSGSPAWYSIPVSSATIDTAGYTEYAMKASIEAWQDVYNQSYSPISYEDGIGGGYEAQLLVSYRVPGAEVSIHLDSGAWLNSTAFPEISEWNLTYDLLYFSVDTVPNTKNFTIAKTDPSWQFRSVAPNCTYHDNATRVDFNGVYDSITYRVWFVAPKASPYSLLHISLYDSFTGEGFFWEQWRVEICQGAVFNNSTAQIVPNPDYSIQSNAEYTLEVLDYFGNGIVNLTFTSNSADVFVSIPVPVYSYKFYNQNPSFALLRIYYNLTGTPYSEFIPPYDSVNRYLKAGTYKFMLTFYDKSGIVGSTYQWIRTIPSSTFPGAGFVILSGDTISEAIIAANGAKAMVRVVADLVSPDLIWVGYTVPQIPAYLLTISNFVINQNLFMVNGELFDSKNGTNMTFVSPTPDNCISPTNSRDLFSFLGNPATRIFINDTSNGTTIFTAATLPASVNLLGGAYTIWTNRSVSVSRDCVWRWYRAFTWQFLAQNEEYISQVTVKNEIGLDWHNVTLFIPFMNESIVNNNSVQIYDMNNTVFLVEGTHFVQSRTGVYLWFNVWNNTISRGFQLSYTSTNESRTTNIARLTVNKIGDGSKNTITWNNQAYYFCLATWINSFRADYSDALYITLDLSISPDPASIKVLTGTGLIIVDAIVNGNTIIIPKISVKVGESVTYTILFNSKRVSSILDFAIAGLPIVMITAFIAVAAFAIGIAFVSQRGKSRLISAGRLSLLICGLALLFLALTTIFFYVTAA